MTAQETQYWKLIEEKVCSHCIDADRHGHCRLGGEEECAVKRFFPGILGVIESVSSDSMEPYEAALRRSICTSCVHQSPEGVCSVRDEVECALDRYFPMIVEAIEEARKGSDKGKG